MTLVNNNKKMEEKEIYSVGDTISFTYKGGRRVKGEILYVDPKVISLKLHTDYIGKNVEWFSGETKHFNVAEMKKIKKIVTP